MKNGFQLGLVGADKNCDSITFSGRKANWNLRANKVADEKECAERFCHAEQRELTTFTEMPQNSPVDIRAESADKKRARDFQITSMLPEDFWKRFGTGTTDVTISREELKEFIRASIHNKVKKKSSSQGVDLLVDCKPADLPVQCLEKLRSDEEFVCEISALGNFRQIWVVSSHGATRLK